MTNPTFGVDSQLIIPVLTALFLFGCGYAFGVGWLGERKTGYVALFVVLGVLVTLAGEAVINPQAALLALICFIASGTPMVAGEIIQHMRARDRAIREYRQMAGDAIRETRQDERP